MVEAEEQAEQRSEEIQNEVINIAAEQAEAIQTEAEREAELLLENQRNEIQVEINNYTHQLYRQLLSKLERIEQQVVGLEVEFEDKLTQHLEETSTVSVEQHKRHDEFVKFLQEWGK